MSPGPSHTPLSLTVSSAGYSRVTVGMVGVPRVYRVVHTRYIQGGTYPGGTLACIPGWYTSLHTRMVNTAGIPAWSTRLAYPHGTLAVLPAWYTGRPTRIVNPAVIPALSTRPSYPRNTPEESDGFSHIGDLPGF